MPAFQRHQVKVGVKANEKAKEQEKWNFRNKTIRLLRYVLLYDSPGPYIVTNILPIVKNTV